MLSLKVRTKNENGIVVMRGEDFPNVVVQGKNMVEAKKGFLKALEFYFEAMAEMNGQGTALLKNEKAHTLKWEIIQ